MLISGDDRRSLTAQRQRAAQPAMSASQQRVQRRAFRQTIHQHDEPHAQPSACLPASKPPGGGRQAPGNGACHTTALRVGPCCRSIPATRMTINSRAAAVS